MCMFCAAVPMSAAMGIALAGKQQQKRQQAQENGEAPALRTIPASKITFAVTGSLLACSAVYHLVIMPHTGAII